MLLRSIKAPFHMHVNCCPWRYRLAQGNDDWRHFFAIVALSTACAATLTARALAWKGVRALTKVLEEPPLCRAVQINKFMLCQVESIHSWLPPQQAKCCLQGMRLKP